MNKNRLSSLMEFTQRLQPERVEMYYDWYNEKTDKGCLVGLYFHDNPCDVKLVETEVCLDMSGQNEWFTYLSYAGKTGSDAAAAYFDLTLEQMQLITWSENLTEAISNIKELLDEKIYFERLYADSSQ